MTENTKAEGRRKRVQRLQRDNTHHTHHSVTQHSSNSAEQHTPPHFLTHNKHHITQREKGDWTIRKGVGQRKMPDPIRRQGITTHTTPRHSIRPQDKRQGGHQHTDGGHQHTAALHSPCHPTIHYATPPSTTAPPSTTTRGERTEDTPPHEQHRHTLTTRTPHARQWNSSMT